MQIRGAGIRSLLLAIEKLHGPAGLEAVKGAVPKHVREQVEHVLPVQWYDVEVSSTLQIAVRDVLGGGKWDESHHIGFEAARIDFGGLYRVFVRADERKPPSGRRLRVSRRGRAVAARLGRVGEDAQPRIERRRPDAARADVDAEEAHPRTRETISITSASVRMCDVALADCRMAATRSSLGAISRARSHALTFDAPLMKPMQISWWRPNIPAGTPL